MTTRPFPFRVWFATTAIYWCGIAVLTHLPPPEEVVGPNWLALPHLDKVFHAAAYAGLAFLLSRTMVARQTAAEDSSPRSSSRLRWIAFAVVASYGAALDELTQPYFRRHCDPWDYAVDLAGAVAGIALATRRRRR